MVYGKVWTSSWHRAKALQRYCSGDHDIVISTRVIPGSFDIVVLPWYLGRQFGGYFARQGAKVVLVWDKDQTVPEWLLDLGCRIVVTGKLTLPQDTNPNVLYLQDGVELELFWPESFDRSPVVLCGVPDYSTCVLSQGVLAELSKALTRRGIELQVKIFQHQYRLSPEEMRSWYWTGAVYCELGSPGAHATQAFEAACCGCGVVGDRTVGNLDLLLEQHQDCLIEMKLSQLLKGIVYCLDNRVGRDLAQSSRPWGWHVKSQGYLDLFRSLGKI